MSEEIRCVPIDKSTVIRLDVVVSALGIIGSILFSGYQFISVPLSQINIKVAVLDTRLSEVETQVEYINKKLENFQPTGGN